MTIMKRFLILIVSAMLLAVMSGCAESEPEVVASMEGFGIEMTDVTSTTATVLIKVPTSAINIFDVLEFFVYSNEYGDKYADICLRNFWQDDVYYSIIQDGKWKFGEFWFSVKTSGEYKYFETVLNVPPSSRITAQISPDYYFYRSLLFIEWNDGYPHAFRENFTRTVTFETLSIQDDPNFTETTDGQPAYLKAYILSLTDNEAVIELSTNCRHYTPTLIISENSDYSNPFFNNYYFGEKVELNGLTANTTYYMKVVFSRLYFAEYYYENVSMIPTPGSFTTAVEGTSDPIE